MTPEAASKVCSSVEGTTGRWGTSQEISEGLTYSPLPHLPTAGVGAAGNQENGHLVAIFVHFLSAWFASLVSCGSSRSVVLVLGKQN